LYLFLAMSLLKMHIHFYNSIVVVMIQRAKRATCSSKSKLHTHHTTTWKVGTY
jgi:hypothetical protein